jgi:putative hydrolase of the HAD superfamily
MHGGRRHAAVLFDLDDTLIDWWGSVRKCLESIAGDDVVDALLTHVREHCWERSPDGSHVWHRNTWALHFRRETMWPAALPWLDPAELTALMRRFDDELWVGFYPDVVPTLDLLVDSTRLGVLTNNHLIADETERLRLHDWFEVAVHAAEGTKKPHPGAFELGAAALGLTPPECVYVGDSIKADALGAMRAGMTAVWLDRWGDDWHDRPDAVLRITSLAELPDALAAG